MNRETGEAAHGRLRIAFVTDTFEIGGTELNAVKTAERLDRGRYDLKVYALGDRGPLRARYEAADIPIIPFPINNLYGPRTWRAGWRFARLVRDAADIIHAHDVYCNIFGAYWGWLARRPAIITSRRWWTEVPREGLRRMNRLAYRLSDRVVANSESVARHLEHSDGVPAGRIVVIPNFVPDEAFEPLDATVAAEYRSRWGLAADALVVGCVANLRAIKNHDVLLRAVARLSPAWPALRVVLVGDGAERQRLEALASELGIRSVVVFAGRLPPRPALPRLFDVAVLCSRGEAFPNAVVEAMAAGRPVVASNVGGIPDAVVDGSTGLLVPPGDIEACAAALDRLLRDAGLRAQFGASGAARAREKYQARAAIARLSALYDDLGRR